MDHVILLRSLRWSKPAGDLKFAAHHCGIIAINRQINIIKHDEGIRSLYVIKKMNQRWPRALCFNGSKNRLMIRRGFPGANGGILDQNIVFAGYLLYLIKKR